MPATSKAQRRLFAMALKYKEGKLDGEASDEIKELSKLPEAKLRDYAETPEKDLPDTVEEAESTNEGKVKELESLINDTTTRGLDILDFLALKEKDWNYFIFGKAWKDKIKSTDPKVKKKLIDAVKKRANYVDEEATPSNTPGMGSTSMPGIGDGSVGSGDIPHDLTGATAKNEEESNESYFMTFESFVNEFGPGGRKRPSYPDNIKKWLKSSATPEQKKAAKKVLPGWTGYIGGGTVVGAKPQTLLLDLSYQGGELELQPNGTIKAFGKEIKNERDFEEARDKARNK